MSTQNTQHPYSVRFFVIVLSALLLSSPMRAQVPASPAAETGGVAGSIGSAQTHNVLQGAVVAIPTLHRQTITDSSGHFLFTGLPAGPVELAISYSEFESLHRTVTVTNGTTTEITIELKPAEIVSLSKFIVAAQMEGNAAVVNKERTAPNIRSIIALDSDISATVPNYNIGELLSRISGTAPSYDQGTVNEVRIRGMANTLTRMTFDGLSAVSAIDGRRPTYTYFSGKLFQQLEVVKGPTPDMSADSIGGTINLVTRSPLSLTGRRRIVYDTGFNWTAPYSNYKPDAQAQRNFQPFIHLGYEQVFDVLGGHRNLGILAHIFYGESQFEIAGLTNMYETGKTTGPVYVYDTRAQDSINNRHVSGLNFKMDYRLSDSSKFSFGFLYNGESEPSIELQSWRAFSRQAVAPLDANGNPTGTNPILPDYTNNVTQVRAVSGSNFVIRNYHLSADGKNPSFTLGGEHKLDNLSFDYKARYNWLHSNSGTGVNGSGGDLTMTAPTVGWIIDRTDPSNPILTQTAGPNISDLSSYTSNVTFTKRNTTVDNTVTEVVANARYQFDTRFPLTLKTGFALKHNTWKMLTRAPQRFKPVPGANALPSVFMPSTPFLADLPIVEPRAVNVAAQNPALWSDDPYYTASQTLMGNKGVTENIQAEYFMTTAKIDALTLVGGVRFEQTQDDAYANVQFPTATAAQIPDPVARAYHDWDHMQINHGSYSRAFPSLHATYNIRPNLVARASWTTSFGRPGFATLMPTATINDTADTIRIGNPGAGPQYAKNIDTKLAYYFKPSGFLSVGYFHKSIKDYLLTTSVGTVGTGPENGYDGNYDGYDILSTVNAGTATASGWEFDYRQQFVFLPGLLKGLELAANYTVLETHGDFGEATRVSGGQVAGFIPHSGSVSLAYRYKNFGTRIVFNYIGRYLATASATPTAQIFQDYRSTVSLNVNYRLRPKLSIYCQLNNLFQQTQDRYEYSSDRLNHRQLISAAIQFGVRGRF